MIMAVAPESIADLYDSLPYTFHTTTRKLSMVALFVYPSGLFFLGRHSGNLGADCHFPFSLFLVYFCHLVEVY
jgi:hypothetical protein